MHWDIYKQDNYSAVGGYGGVGSARYEPALLLPCLTTAAVAVRDPPIPFLREFSEILRVSKRNKEYGLGSQGLTINTNWCLLPE